MGSSFTSVRAARSRHTHLSALILALVVVTALGLVQTRGEAAPALVAQSGCQTGETLLVPFSGGPTSARTTRSYSGAPISLVVSGVGQAAGGQYSDAFYLYADANNRPFTPQHSTLQYNWVLWINDQHAENFISGKQIPAYRADHVYTFTVSVPVGILSFGIGDVGTSDNVGSYTVDLCQGMALSDTPTATSTPTSTATNTPTSTATNTPTSTTTNTPTATTTNTPVLESLTITIRPGWQIIAMPLVTANTFIEAALSPIAGSYDQAYAADRTLSTIGPTTGLWVHGTQATSLTVMGRYPANATLRLAQGWNLVGFPIRYARPPTEILATLGTTFDQVLSYPATGWQTYLPAGGAGNTLNQIEPGQGYWIHMTEAATLTITNP